MPKKGDDFDSLTAKTAVEHCSNVDITLPDTTVIKGLFAREYIEVSGFEGFAPVVSIDNTDYLTAKRDDILTIKGQNFTIRKIQPDGVGMTNIILHEA